MMHFLFSCTEVLHLPHTPLFHIFEDEEKLESDKGFLASDCMTSARAPKSIKTKNGTKTTKNFVAK